MNLNKPVHINRWLMPVSWLYGFVVYIRNLFFKLKIFKQKEYDIPIICVGNISVGGTGKTPHTEYLIRLLKDDYRVAVLSRGYKRKTKDFVLASTESTSRQIGDEPFQIKQKFPDIIVAVDRKRTRGVEKLLAMDDCPDIIILDDGFQHRYLKPSYSIILSDYNRPLYEDKLLPAGRLREPVSYLKYASDIIITKCPEDLQPIDRRIILRDLNLLAYQSLSFTTFSYQKLLPVFSEDSQKAHNLSFLKNKDVLLVTGIASPRPLYDKISAYTKKIESLEYKDHHLFKLKDIKDIIEKFDQIRSDNKIIVVTEKDAVKLKHLKVDDNIKSFFCYIPIEVSFFDEESRKEFEERIINHVSKNKRNS